jgi:glycosyltransferase involved in cell wall biosynthesis
MSLTNKLTDKRIVIATHIYATGPSHSLEDFLKDKVQKLLFIGHPFVYAKDTKSHYRLYQKGLLIKQKYVVPFKGSQVLSQVKDTLLNIFFVFVNGGKFDLFVGVDSSNAIVGIFLKKIGLVKKVVFYTIDYVPNRFENKILNAIYHKMDKISVEHSDSVWNLSSIMADERENKGISKKFRSKQIVVPVGTEGNIKIINANKTKKFHIVHMGHLIKKQGVQLLLDAVPLVVKKIPQFHLEIIGGGEYEDILKKQVKDLKITKYVTFHGFVKNHAEVEKMVSYCEFGVAPYTDSPDNYVKYTDPGKVKAYLAAGLPVIITKVPEVYHYLVKKKCGIAVAYKVDELANAIISLLEDQEKLTMYRRNALVAAKEFSWDKIFTKALENSL